MQWSCRHWTVGGGGRYWTGIVYPVKLSFKCVYEKESFWLLQIQTVYHSLAPSIKITRGNKNKRNGKEVKDLLFTNCTYFCLKQSKAFSLSSQPVEEKWMYLSSPQDSWLDRSNRPDRRYELSFLCRFTVSKCEMGRTCWQSPLNPDPSPCFYLWSLKRHG